MLLAVSVAGGCTGKGEVDTSVYMDASQPVEKRVEALLSQMTLEEKIGQMDMVAIWSKQKIEEQGKLDYGAWIGDAGPDVINEIQKLSEQTRLKIPYLMGVDAAHGHALLSGKTVFPSAISMAATFNRDLVKDMYAASASEIRSVGNQWTFAPCVDIVQDARWGRTGETYGEDPYLASEMVRNAVSGLQDWEDPQKRVAVSVKHLLGGGASIGGCNHASAELSEREVRSYFLPPFQAAIEAGCMTIMPGHNDVDGIPAHASKWLLTDVVKNEMGFDGFYISDMGDVENLKNKHHVAACQKEAVRQAFYAGLDMHMYYGGDSTRLMRPWLEELVKEGKISEQRIDDAVRRILRVKFELGLFENRYVDPAKEISAPEAHRALALEGARENIVLLKNEGSLLPLDLKKYKRILVTGPNANNQAILGDWAFPQPEENVTTVLEGLRQATEGQVEVVYSNSGRIRGKVAKDKIDTTDPVTQARLLEEGGEISDYSIMDAVKKARGCDLAIVVVGGYGLRSDWGLRTYGESADRPSIDFYGRQEELIRAVSQTGIPVVAVIVNGKPLNNEWTTRNIPAIVDVWEPGMYGGQALAEILLGKVNPSGKLPITIPQQAGQVPMFYYQKETRYSTGYALGSSRADDRPAYCFGHGLSYTRFEYSDLKMDTLLTAGQDLKISFRVKNAGEREGKEVPMLFIGDDVSSVVTPIAMLKGFDKITLRPGEEKNVDFTVPYNQLGLWNAEMKYVVEPGTFSVRIGRSYDDIRLKGAFEVVE